MSGVVVECQESRSGSTTSPQPNGQDVLAGWGKQQLPAGSALTFARMHFVMSVDEPPTGMEAHDFSLPLLVDFPVVEGEWRPSLPALAIKRKRQETLLFTVYKLQCPYIHSLQIHKCPIIEFAHARRSLPLEVISLGQPSFLVAPSTVSPITPWRREMEILVLGTVSCASVVFLLLTAIICYKAIKRKPLRKEENGTSRGEYAMSSRCKQQDLPEEENVSQSNKHRKSPTEFVFRSAPCW
ncbi:proline-rich membrane anchor 1 [Labeo rohita]|uniref:Proline-rich membrane anchor 1 n=1 Tax=Labeo rohita TaxID=84645 RepID=A0A498NBE0_LABRO|nr:proline-rich membrane anchor 1 [Labeo rohita]